MTRLLVHVEGQSEENFVNQVLALHLSARGFSNVWRTTNGKRAPTGRRGGIRAWATVRTDIVNHLKEDSECVVSTMVDYYGLPQDWPKGLPGRKEACELTFPNNARTVENGIAVDIYKEMGSGFNHERFIPYLMIHEFEAMLFSDCERFAEGIGQPKLAPKFQGIRDMIGCPEEIDDSPQTASSKRIASLVPGHQKPFMGTLASLEIGLAAIRSACPHFRSWLKCLEHTPCQMDA